jgi:hypothetical protein
VRRSAAAARLREWDLVRPTPTALVEAQVNLVIGLVLLFYLVQSPFGHRAEPYIVSGVLVGFGVTLLISSVRRGKRRVRWWAIALGVPTTTGAALWTLTVLIAIWR